MPLRLAETPAPGLADCSVHRPGSHTLTSDGSADSKCVELYDLFVVTGLPRKGGKGRVRGSAAQGDAAKRPWTTLDGSPGYSGAPGCSG